MGKGFANFMSKKDFHPAAPHNQKKVWEAREKKKIFDNNQAEMAIQYQKEQELLNNKALLGDEKARIGLSFMYDAPTGINKRDEEKVEPKFEWQRKYNAPREAWAKNNDQIVDQPFGIEVKHIKCVKCGKWGHVNTDKECPLWSKASVGESDEYTSTNPSDIFKSFKVPFLPAATADRHKIDQQKGNDNRDEEHQVYTKNELAINMKEEHGIRFKAKILSRIHADEALNNLGPSQLAIDKEAAFQEFFKSFSDAEKIKILEKILKKEKKKEEKSANKVKKEHKEKKKSKTYDIDSDGSKKDRASTRRDDKEPGSLKRYGNEDDDREYSNKRHTSDYPRHRDSRVR
uniref:Cir_N domain-containing protein n=1 Tax=Rhabditophanes sp. KR3021 TaxID=114890 RepID=A0AC35THM4_9BILA